MNCPEIPHLHSVEDVCLMIGCDSEEWLVERVRTGVFPARRIVRALRFSDQDIASIIEASAVKPKHEEIEPLMPTTMRGRRVR